ncbi:MAG: DUF4097 family beta strand repeat-containing protein [Thermoanaerobaculaceae bacterium]|nr:DUF4097 family beta strand repeat-containing protein [Thermoanaerobaculaceae bacterium]
MRRAVLAAALTVLVAGTGCVRVRTPLALHETHTFAAGPDKLVRLDVGSIDLHVDVAEGTAITAALDLDARSSSRGAAQRWIANHTPVFEDSASALEIRLPSRHRGIFVLGYLNARARIDLVVPPECRLEVRTSSGDVRIGGGALLAAPARVTTSSGDLTVEGGLRDLIARTSSGDVRVTRHPLVSLEADTSSGDVTLESGSEHATVDTSSGDVRLEKLAGDLSATASSGDVSASWERIAPVASIRVRTSSGDVRLRVPAATALAGEINTTSGSIHSSVDGTRGRRDHRLSFAAAGPATTVEVHTSSGDVSLRTHR